MSQKFTGFTLQIGIITRKKITQYIFFNLIINLCLLVLSNSIYASCSDEQRMEMLNSGISSDYIIKNCDNNTKEINNTNHQEEKNDLLIADNDSFINLKDDNSKEAPKKIIGIGVGNSYSGLGVLGALFIDQKILLGGSFGINYLPDDSGSTVIGSNFLGGYLFDPSYIIFQYGIVGTYYEESCYNMYFSDDCENEGGIINGSTILFGYSNDENLGGFNANIGFITSADSPSILAQQQLVGSVAFSIGYNFDLN